MKKAMKILGIIVLLAVVSCGGYVGYVSATWDKDYSAVEKPALKASSDPEVIKRGEYIAHSVAHCSICHVPHDVTVARKLGEHPPMVGGYEWKMGPMGTLYSRNITPDPATGIGNWTDEELARAIRSGVGRDGKALVFMSMAVPELSDEDLLAVISYLRSTPPVVRQNKPHDLGLMLKWLATKVGPDFRKNNIKPAKYVPQSEEPTVARGEYLARGPASCVSCHTGFDMMEMKVVGPDFAGNDQAEPDPENEGMEFVMPNLTPDPETGHMAKWDEDQFVSRFRAGRVVASSKMPWEAYREMTDADLRSLYRFFKTLPPTKRLIGAPYRKAGTKP